MSKERTEYRIVQMEVRADKRNKGGDEGRECRCDCRACYDADCAECDIHMNECGDPDNCDGDMNDERTAAYIAELRGKKTKRVDGEDLSASAFAYVGDSSKTDTWKLPIHFSTEEKTKSHIQKALARFGQTQGIPAGEKPNVLAKIKAAAREHGIHGGSDESNASALEIAKRKTYLAEIA